jgi:uncharacterized membrane-anchored protein
VAFWIAVGVQVFLMAAVPATKIWVRSTGETVMLSLRPVDPYDPARGYHLVLAYEIGDASVFENAELAAGRGTVYATVAADADGVGRPVRLTRERPETLGENEVALRGRARSGRISYGIETFYIPEEGRVEREARLREQFAETRAEVKVAASGDAALVALHFPDETLR